MTAAALVAIALLVLINAFFVAAEFALVKVRPQLAADAEPGADGPAHQSSGSTSTSPACQIGITIASLALGGLGEPTIAGLLEPALRPLRRRRRDRGHSVIALLAMTALHITVGEQAPKSFAIGSAERVAAICAYPLEAFYRLLRPLVIVLNVASNGIVGCSAAPRRATPSRRASRSCAR